MFIYLLFVTFVIALGTSISVAWLFDRPINRILARVIADDISEEWQKYIKFAIYVVGISGGVRIWDLEKYISPRSEELAPLTLNTDRWILEVYRTLIGTLQSIAWMLLIFFVFALIAYVIVRISELRTGPKGRP